MFWIFEGIFNNIRINKHLFNLDLYNSNKKVSKGG